MKKEVRIVIGVLAILVAAGVWFALRSPADRKSADRTKVRLQLQWTPQAQFIGFYVAEAKSFYAEEGLAVEFSHGGPDINPIQRLVNQQVDIALAPGDQVLVWQSNHSNENVSLKAAGTVFKRNIAVFMSRRGQGISTPHALKGRRVGVYPSRDTENVLLCLLNKHGINPSEVEIRAFPNLQEFLSAKANAVDVFPSYLINEPLLAEQSGVAVDLIDPEQFGVKFYSDTIIATGTYLAQNRDVVKKFLRASERGWDFSRSNPAAALQLMYQVVGPSIGRGEAEKHQARMLRATLDYVDAGAEKRMFEMEKSRWEEMAKSLSEIGRVKTREVYLEVCDFKIVDEASRKAR